jgi:hypothetical protein
MLGLLSNELCCDSIILKVRCSIIAIYKNNLGK